MCDPKDPPSALPSQSEQEKATLEKTNLEIEEIRDNLSTFGKTSRIALPFISGLIALVISIASFVISNRTSNRQMDLEERLKDREAFRSAALDLAFGEKVNDSGHAAGIWALSEF
jgi:hypothetical protein